MTRSIDVDVHFWQNGHCNIEWGRSYQLQNIVKMKWRLGVLFGIRWRGFWRRFVLSMSCDWFWFANYVYWLDLFCSASSFSCDCQYACKEYKVIYKWKCIAVFCCNITLANVLQKLYHQQLPTTITIINCLRNQWTSWKNTATTPAHKYHNYPPSPPSSKFKPTFAYDPWQVSFLPVTFWMGWHSGPSFVLSI